jgi:hypothetical protein
MSHTPGPWRAEIQEDIWSHLEDQPRGQERTGWILGPNNEPVLDYEGCGSHAAEWANPADLTLALAAPDLLSALERVLADAVYDAERTDEAIAAVAQAKAAIAKARGEGQ